MTLDKYKEYKRCKTLYDIVKNKVEISDSDKRFCSLFDCFFARPVVLYCNLFEQKTPYCLRCSKCVEIFGNK